MTSKRVDQALEYAQVAQDVAKNAMGSAGALGIILESLIGVLRDSGALSSEDVKRVFLTSAALVDSMPGPEDENGKLLQSGMREIVRRVALAFHVAIPPSGQVPIQSKH